MTVENKSTGETTRHDQPVVQGKLWVNEVRVCFMEAVAPFHKGMHTCDTIKSVAFESHVSCYKDSKHFCKMASVANNRDALFNIYEPNELWDFWGLTAWLQVLMYVYTSHRTLARTHARTHALTHACMHVLTNTHPLSNIIGF